MSCHNEKPEMNQAVNHPQGSGFVIKECHLNSKLAGSKENQNS